MTEKALREQLSRRWHADTNASRNDNAISACFEGIVRSYSEPHRAYHTLAHLAAVFDKLDRHAVDASEPSRLSFACWYHDIVYDAAAKDNEERSAQRAEAELSEMGANPDFIARVAKLIRATASHATAKADDDDALFLDADYAILGAPEARYRAYVGEVRREYAHVDDAGWRNGRGAFLRLALAQPRIFRTAVFEAAYAAQARKNIAWELTRLTGSAP